MPTREHCGCGAQLELGDHVAAPAMTLEGWRKTHRHDNTPVEHELPDPSDVKGTLPQVPAGGVYSNTSFGPSRRVVVARTTPFTGTVSLNWRTP